MICEHDKSIFQTLTSDNPLLYTNTIKSSLYIMSKNHCKIETQEIVKRFTCFVFHVNNDCKSADIFNVKLTCTKVEDTLLQLEPLTNR